MNQIDLDAGGRLGRRIARGGAWLFALHVTQQGVGLLRLVIVARLLTPADLGLFGMGLLAIAVLMASSDTGIEPALIQRRSLTDIALDVAWTATVARNILIAALLLLSADVVAAVFDEQAAAPVMRALALVVLLDGLTNISIVLIKKRMEFARIFTYQIWGLLAEFVTTVVLAILWRSVWALVFGQVAGSATRLVASYLISPRRPRIKLDLAELKSLYGYGRWLTLSGMLIFLLVQGDDALVGIMFGAATLGLYQMAYRISNLPATGIAGVLANLLFPAYSSVSDRVERLAPLYLRAVRLTSSLALPVSALIACLAYELTLSVLGSKWLAIVPSLQVLALYGALRTLGATTGPIFLSLGRPDLRTKIQLGQLAVLALTIYPLASALGMLGVALSVTLYALIFNLVALVRASQLCRLRVVSVLRVVALPAVASLAAATLVVLTESRLPATIGLVRLATSAVLGCSAYVLILLVADRMGSGVYRDELSRLVRSFVTGPGRSA